MPRKTVTGMDHVKAVKRNGATYLYFNTGQKNEHGRVIYAPIGKVGSRDLGLRYTTALANRTKRANAPTLLTMPAFIRLFEKSPEFRKLSQGTQRTYGVYLRQLEHAFNNAPAEGVEPRDIYALVDNMADRAGAANMILLVARKLFRWGKKRHHVPTDPTDGIDLLDEGGEYEPWPEHLVEEALEDARIKLPVALLYFTAQRIGDVCALRWSDIRDGVVYVTQEKTGKELEIPVHSRLAEILAAAPRKGITILTDPKGRKAKDQTIRGWLKAFGRARGFDVVPHGLRKNAVNALLEAGCSTGETSSISGQSLRIVEHYAKKRSNRKMGKAAILKWENAS